MAREAARPASVLQITDCHLRAARGARLLGVDTAQSLEAVLARALAEREPDALLVTGDVAHDPVADTYERFFDLLGCHYRGPLLLLPGNHDLGAALVARARAHARSDLHVAAPCAVLSLPGWDVIGADSHVDDLPEALCAADVRASIASACAASRADGRRALLALHHPLLPVGSPWLDKDRVQNGAELLEWLSAHSSVEAVVFGHAHQAVEDTFSSIRLFGSPSTCFQFAPHSERFTIGDEKPGYRWLFLGADGTVASELCRVEDYPLSIDLNQRD